MQQSRRVICQPELPFKEACWPVKYWNIIISIVSNMRCCILFSRSRRRNSSRRSSSRRLRSSSPSIFLRSSLASRRCASSFLLCFSYKIDNFVTAMRSFESTFCSLAKRSLFANGLGHGDDSGSDVGVHFAAVVIVVVASTVCVDGFDELPYNCAQSSDLFKSIPSFQCLSGRCYPGY